MVCPFINCAVEDLVVGTNNNIIQCNQLFHLVGKIDRKHTAYAKKVLQTKFLIGLLPQLDESMRRFEKYFGWEDKSGNNHSCVNDLVGSGMNTNSAKKPVVEEWSKEYVMLLRHNSFDLEVFHYAEELFDQQGKYFDSLKKSY